MAWFRRKNGDAATASDAGEHLVSDPELARKWLKHAQTAADTRNYAYAVECYLHAIKHDPSNLDTHRTLLSIADLYRTTGGKPASRRELAMMLGDKKPAERLAAAELAWVKDAFNTNYNLKFVSEAGKLGLNEVAYWAGEIGFNALSRGGKKVSKNTLLQYVDIFDQIGASEMAVKVGEMALAMDRSDAQLQARIRNLSAQATMDRGRYDTNVGEEGGFRRSIRDADAQRDLVEEESYAAGHDAVARRLARARAEHEQRPTDPNVIQKFGELLAKSGDAALEQEAIKVFQAGYEATSEYRFRMQAADVTLAQARRQLRARRAKAEASGDPQDQASAEEAARQILEREVAEYRDRVKNYPTDLGLKFTFGEKLFQARLYEEAIPALQEAQQDVRHRARAQHLIGLCFFRQEWFDEAMESLRTAVDSYEFKDDETHLGMRYDLMEALEAHARENKDLDAAESAGEQAKQIALKKVNFRQLMQKRNEIRQLIKELRG